jgi:hypothetical protein
MQTHTVQIIMHHELRIYTVYSTYELVDTTDS